MAFVANSAVEEGSRQLLCLESINTSEIHLHGKSMCVDRLHLDINYSDASELSAYLDHIDIFK